MNKWNNHKIHKWYNRHCKINWKFSPSDVRFSVMVLQCCMHDGPGLERDMQALILLLCIFFVFGERLHPEMAWITNKTIQSIQFSFGGDFFPWWVAPLVQMFTFECLFCEQSISEFIDQINSRDWNALVCVCSYISYALSMHFSFV